MSAWKTSVQRLLRRGEVDGMKANWQNERGAIDLVQDLKSQIED